MLEDPTATDNLFAAHLKKSSVQNCTSSPLPQGPPREKIGKLLVMRTSDCDVPEVAPSVSGVETFAQNYEVEPERVAEALLVKIDAMADERARFRRSLIYAVEMIETPDLDFIAARIN